MKILHTGFFFRTLAPLLVALSIGLALAFSGQAWAMPSLALATDKKKLAAGESMVLTLNFVVPSLDLVGITGGQVSYAAPAGFTITAAKGPLLISNFATLTWDGGSVVSNTVTVRIIGASKDYTPVANAVTIPVGDLGPGEGDVATVTVQR